MKKIFYAVALIIMMSMSCDPDPGPAIGSEEQKEKLENAANELMTEFSADNYEDLAKIVEDCCDYGFNDFPEDYDWSDLEDALEEKLDKLYSMEELSGDAVSHTVLILMSECNGHVTIGKNKATYKPADDARLFVETDDAEWEIILKPVGKVQEMYLGEFMGYNYDWETGTEYEEYYDITVEVPESLVLQINRNGSQFAKVTLNFNINLSEYGVDIEKDKASVSTVFEFQGLELTVNRFSYNAATGAAESSAQLKNNGKMIFSYKVSGVGKVDIEDEDNWIAKKINVEADLMGKIQIAGSCPDAKSLVSIFDNADPYTAADWERIVNNANKLFDLSVYYDGGSTEQAKLVLEPRWHESEWGDDYYVELAIEFADGSRYLLYEFFTEENFQEVINGAMSFIEGYEDLLEKYFGDYDF